MVKFSSIKNFDDHSEKVTISGQSVTSTNDYLGGMEGGTTCYALRFMGTEYMSAWKYEWTMEGTYGVMKIASSNVDSSTTITDVAKSSFWTPSSSDVVRIFPASGLYAYGSLVKVNGVGDYYAAPESIRPEPHIIYLTRDHVRSVDNNYLDHARSIRLFFDNI